MNKELLRKLMLERNVRPEELAFKAGISIATVYNMLEGRSVHLRTAYSVAKVLDIPPQKLVPEKFNALIGA
jgi:predicted transcriptional regulator